MTAEDWPGCPPEPLARIAALEATLADVRREHAASRAEVARLEELTADVATEWAVIAHGQVVRGPSI